MTKQSQYFDSKQLAADKEALRAEDLRIMASGEISRADHAKQNSFFGALDLRSAKMVRRPNVKIEC